MSLILASKSAARRAILDGAGVVYEAADSRVDEEVVKARLLATGAGPRAIAEALAAEKALAVSREHIAYVIGADQTLDLAGALYDKAHSVEEARGRLMALRGRSHQLHSAVAVAKAGDVIWRHTVSATLTMRDVSDAFIETYLKQEGAAALGSVGCYRLEGLGAQLFTNIEGDYFAILGLPLLSLLDLLRAKGELAT